MWLVGLNVIERAFVQSPSKSCPPFPNSFYRLFTRWIHDITFLRNHRQTWRITFRDVQRRQKWSVDIGKICTILLIVFWKSPWRKFEKLIGTLCSHYVCKYGFQPPPPVLHQGLCLTSSAHTKGLKGLQGVSVSETNQIWSPCHMTPFHSLSRGEEGDEWGSEMDGLKAPPLPPKSSLLSWWMLKMPHQQSHKSAGCWYYSLFWRVGTGRRSHPHTVLHKRWHGGPQLKMPPPESSHSL